MRGARKRDSRLILFRAASSVLIILSTCIFAYSVVSEWGQARFYAVLDLMVFLVFMTIALTIVVSKSDSYLVLAVSVALVLYAVTGSLGFGALSRQVMRVCPGLWILQSVECARTFYTPADYWSLMLDFLTAVSTVSVPILAYLFPDGHFVPRWTRWLAAVWVAWGAFALAFPVLNPSAWSPPEYALLLYVFGLGTGICAQVYRYRNVSTPDRRQQTKWVAFGFAAAAIVGSVLLALIISVSYFVPVFNSSEAQTYNTVFVSAYFVSQSIFPICIGLAILRHRLWDIDVVINRALIYALLSVILFLVFWASDKVLEGLLQPLLNAFAQLSNLSQNSSQYSGVGSTMIVGMAVSPLHKRTEEVINRMFYKDRLHLRKMFSECAHEARNITDLSQLLNVLIRNSCKLLKIRYGAVYLGAAAGSLKLAKSQNLPSRKLKLAKDESTLDRLSRGESILKSEDRRFPLVLPLTLPSSAKKKSKASVLVGIFAFGPRNSGLGYSSDDRSMLQDFADEVAPAVYFASRKRRRKAKPT